VVEPYFCYHTEHMGLWEEEGNMASCMVQHHIVASFPHLDRVEVRNFVID
jgi:hypothetical protein